MKNNSILMALAATGLLVAGCDKKQTASQQLDAAQQKTVEAVKDMKDYTFAQKDEFVGKMQGQLDALNKDLSQLSAKVESSSDSIKAEAKPKLEALRDQAAKLNDQLDNVKSATESTWDTVKAGTQKACDTLQEEFKKSRQWLSDKIAP